MQKSIHSFVLFFSVMQVVYSQNEIAQKDSLFLSINTLNYNKNNEYFNHIADGYTLLGTELHPKLSYKPHPEFQLELGVFGLFYYGEETYHKVIPTFSLDYKLGKLDMTVGTLHNENLHHLIAPLMTSETLLDERIIENGSQLRYFSNRFNVDAWLNWETFIFKSSPIHEELVGGVTMDYLFINQKRWQLKIPFQNLYYHHGGQINTNLLEDRNTFTVRHTVLGIDSKFIFSEQQYILFKTYFLQYQSTETPSPTIFTKGTGFLSELDFQYRYFSVGVGYWSGNKFVSPRGDDIFQSVSKKTDINYIDGEVQPYYAGHTEPERSLILGKLSYKKELYPDLFVSTEVKFYYQNYASNPTYNPENKINNVLDYNYSVQVRYKGLFRLK